MASVVNRHQRHLRTYLKPPLYVRASIIISLGGLLFGMDTGSIGPVTTMKSLEDTIGPLSSTLHGFIVSSILIPAAVASFFAGHLADRLGRPHAIMVGELIFACGAGLEAGAHHLILFVLGRAIAGIGEGLFLSTIVVYVCEVSPPQQRGALASIVQFLISVGVAGGYFIAYGTVRISSSASWRTPLAVQAGLALVFAACCLGLPQSPRWLTHYGRVAEANQTWDRLGVSSAEREKESATTASGAVTALSQSSVRTQSWKSSLHELLRIFKRDVRKQTALGAFVMGMLQLSGIDGVLYYAPLLFRQAGLPSQQASFLASGLSALLMMLVNIPASLYADRWGRRTLIIAGGLILSACMILIGSLYASDSVRSTVGAARWVVVVAIYIFAITFIATWAIGIRIYASEIHPSSTRASATSLAQSINWIMNWIVAFTTPIFLARSSFGVYFLFGFSSLFTVVICFLFMPETRGRDLESINRLFEDKLPARKIAAFAERVFRSRRCVRPQEDTDMHGGLVSDGPSIELSMLSGSHG